MVRRIDIAARTDEYRWQQAVGFFFSVEYIVLFALTGFIFVYMYFLFVVHAAALYMIEVTLTGGQTVRAGLSKLKLAGKFLLNPRAQKAADFDNQIYYQMRVDELR